MHTRKYYILAITLVSLLCVGDAVLFFRLPPVRDRLNWYAEYYWLKIYRTFYPPEEELFIPQQQIAAIVQATMQAIAPTSTATSNPPATEPPAAGTPIVPVQLVPTGTPIPSLTPTPTATPLPSQVMLRGFRNEVETRNDCGPTTLAMALSYWGWQGDQALIRSALRPLPEVDDKNVFPGEMEQYTLAQTNLRALVRVGGDLEMLKRLIAAGFPVIVEKGHITTGWIGHYVLLSGYDEDQDLFFSQDSLIKTPDSPVPYAEFTGVWWRHFNYTYLVVYPAEREGELFSVLGPQADAASNFQFAAEKARQEIPQDTGRELFFAWYNLGSSLVGLGDYAGAAQAYDTAFAVVYPTIPSADRPWRALWYEIGPYLAYYNTGRYQDVMDLADTILRNAALEESYYWRGRAREAQGDVSGALQDYRRAMEINPSSTPAQQEIQRLGG